MFKLANYFYPPVDNIVFYPLSLYIVSPRAAFMTSSAKILSFLTMATTHVHGPLRADRSAARGGPQTQRLWLR